MTTYKILYWQEIPTQIKAEDESEDVAVMLDAKFMAQVDILAAKRGLQAADDYLAQGKWSEEEEREGSAREGAEAGKTELEEKGVEKFPANGRHPHHQRTINSGHGWAVLVRLRQIPGYRRAHILWQTRDFQNAH